MLVYMFILKYIIVFLNSTDDQLALYSVELGVDLQSHDFELWPLLPVNVPLRITVKNHGGYIGNSTAELFYVSIIHRHVKIRKILP